MSGDDELEGENDEGFWQHFTPVVRSVQRTVTSRSIQAYAVSFLGIMVLSASLGGAVIGAYAPLQQQYGLCNRPVLDVYTTHDTMEKDAGSAPPNFPHIAYEDLSPGEQHTFREAHTAAGEDAKLPSKTTPHIQTFRQGAIVTYRGAPHYTVIESMNTCSPTDQFSLPLNILGLVVGLGLVVAPSLWRRFR